MLSSGLKIILLELLNHENVDVALCVVSVMMELLDPLLLQETGEGNREEEKNSTIVEPMEKARNMALLAKSFIDGGGLAERHG